MVDDHSSGPGLKMVLWPMPVGHMSSAVLEHMHKLVCLCWDRGVRMCPPFTTQQSSALHAGLVCSHLMRGMGSAPALAQLTLHAIKAGSCISCLECQLQACKRFYIARADVYKREKEVLEAIKKSRTKHPRLPGRHYLPWLVAHSDGDRCLWTMPVTVDMGRCVPGGLIKARAGWAECVHGCSQRLLKQPCVCVCVAYTVQPPAQIWTAGPCRIVHGFCCCCRRWRGSGTCSP
jgi:hypothetical protein